LIDGVPISAGLFDVVVYAYHNARILYDQLKQSCYFYLPKVDFMEEAILWDDILSKLEHHLGVPRYSFKVTVIVESITAVFELDEIIFHLKHRLVGLNTGRWNYINSILKRFASYSTPVFLPRDHINSDAPFLKAFNSHVVHSAHKRGVHAIGGASNYLPKLNNPKATELALKKVT
jgi:malate synthase